MNNWLKYFNEAEISGFRGAENLYGKAYLICEKVFEGKKNKAGLPYMDYLNRIDVRYKPQYEKIKVYLSESEES